MWKWMYDPCGCKKNQDLTGLLNTLESQLKDLEDKVANATQGSSRTATLSSTTWVKFEHIIYMNIYGPPVDGVWNPVLLQEIYDNYKDK